MQSNFFYATKNFDCVILKFCIQKITFRLYNFMKRRTSKFCNIKVKKKKFSCAIQNVYHVTQYRSFFFFFHKRTIKLCNLKVKDGYIISKLKIPFKLYNLMKNKVFSD